MACIAAIEIRQLQVDGVATITAIDTCPALSSGEGRAVTGRFVTRRVDEIARIEVLGADGQIETIEGTTIHPIWSLDRNDWVPLGELQEGERLLSGLPRPASATSGIGFEGIEGEGQAAIVIAHSIHHRSTPIYNIEVHGQHVYQVGELGLLVHNACAGYHHFAPRAWGSNVPYGPKYLNYLTSPQHTSIHRASSDFLKQRRGEFFNAKSGAWWQSNVSRNDRFRDLIDFHRMFDASNGTNTFQLMMKEIRAGFRAGFNPLG